MFGDIKGYVSTKKDAKVTGATNEDQFRGKILRVIDWAVDNSGALVVNNEGTALGMIENEHFLSSFKCDHIGNVLLPLGLNFIEKTVYQAKVLSRKGGYNDMCRQLVIMNSLHSKEFNDHVLWAKQ